MSAASEIQSSNVHMQDEEPKRHYFGSQLELADDDSDTSTLPAPPKHNADLENEPQKERLNVNQHYPQ